MNPQASGPEHDRPRRSPGHRGLLCPACINDVRQIRTHKGLLRRRGLVTQRLPGAPPAGKTPQTHPAAQAKKPRSQPHANPHSLSTWCWVQAGLRFLPLSLASFAVALLTGRLIGKVAMRVLLGVAMVAAAAGLASMAHLTATSTWLVLLPGLILAGVG